MNVVKFTGQWKGRGKAPSRVLRIQQDAVRDARFMMDAKLENDSWVAVLLLGILASLSRDQRRYVEETIARQSPGKNIERALTLVRMSLSDGYYAALVQNAADSIFHDQFPVADEDE